MPRRKIAYLLAGLTTSIVVVAAAMVAGIGGTQAPTKPPASNNTATTPPTTIQPALTAAPKTAPTVSATYTGDVYVAGSGSRFAYLDTAGKTAGFAARGTRFAARPAAGLFHEVLLPDGTWYRMSRANLAPMPCSTPDMYVLDLTSSTTVEIFQRNDLSSPAMLKSATSTLPQGTTVKLRCNDIYVDASVSPGMPVSAGKASFIGVSLASSDPKVAGGEGFLRMPQGAVATPGTTNGTQWFWKRP